MNHRKLTAYGILLALVFMVSRAMLMAAFSSVSYVIMDTLKDIPRIVVASIAYCLAVKTYSSDELGLHRRFTWLPFAFLAAEIIIDLAILPSAEKHYTPIWQIAVLVVNSFVVGFFEEVLFRGLILQSIKKWLGVWPAIFISSILFMLFHFQAQRLEHFPSIFLYGMVAAILRLSGQSLWVLMIIHGVFDSLTPFIEGHVPDEHLKVYYFYAYGVYAAVAVVIWLLSKKRLES